MARSLTYSGVTAFDSDGDGIVDKSASGTLTKEFDDQGNLVHDLSTIDPNGDGAPDFRDESRFTYDVNNNVVTQVTESHRPGGVSSVRAISHAYDALGKLVALGTDLDRGADGVIDSRTGEQFTYDEQGRQITHTEQTDLGADGSVNETRAYTNTYSAQGALIVGATDADANGTIDSRSTAQNTYDQNNHLLTSSVDSDNNADGKIDYHEVVNNTYDAQGNLVSEHQEIDRDANGVADFRYVASHTYNAQGELTSSEFHYDLNGDGIDDLHTSQNLVVPSGGTGGTGGTGGGTGGTEGTEGTGGTGGTEGTGGTGGTEGTGDTGTGDTKLRVPDYFSLLERSQDGKEGITFADFDNGQNDPAGGGEYHSDGVIDSYDRSYYDSEDLQALNDILSGGDPQKYANKYSLEDSGPDRRADLETLRDLIKAHTPPYPEHKVTEPTTGGSEGSTGGVTGQGGNDSVTGQVNNMQAQNFEDAQYADLLPPEGNLTTYEHDFILL